MQECIERANVTDRHPVVKVVGRDGRVRARGRCRCDAWAQTRAALPMAWPPGWLMAADGCRRANADGSFFAFLSMFVTGAVATSRPRPAGPAGCTLAVA